MDNAPSGAPSGAPSVAPLAGVKVLELSQIMAGPTCGLLLSDMGADVIKIEKWPGGDDARGYSKASDGSGPGAMAASFMMINRGKRSLAVDIRTLGGQAVVKRLVQNADVLTENFRSGTLEKQGLGYDELVKVNPALIYCAINGYGPTGPMAQKGGFDLILQAFSGLISVTGEVGGKPVKTGNSVADMNAGIIAAFGILAAYIQRLKTGKGARVDTSLLQSSVHQMMWFAAGYFSTGHIPKPAGTAHPLIAPYQTFACADGDIAIGGANQSNWERIATVLEQREWVTDPRFIDGATRLANRAELADLMSEKLLLKSVAEWVAIFDMAGVPAGPVNNVAQALEHEQTKAVGMVIDVDHPGARRGRALGAPLHLNGHSFANTGVPPRVGEHTGRVMKELGFSDEEIGQLLDAQVVFQA
jgi:crotonobetainyl-CoA:carnitine CoA-transferase CaiB-like acyl-CoA transferase